MNQAATNNNEVLVPRTRDAEGRPVYQDHLTPTGDTCSKVLLAKKPAPIPVIFVPGIMGTNLKKKGADEVVWRPPNVAFSLGDLTDAIGAFFTWWRRGPRKRQELLDPKQTEVDDRGPVAVGESGLNEEAVRLRGWGKVSRTFYHRAMAVLEQHLDRIVSQGKVCDWWQGDGAHDPADYGEELGGMPPLGEPELFQAARYQFDVWCAGYNWLQSNRESALAVADYIENTVIPFYQKKGEVTAEMAGRMKVILVTHSMGGLVARALTQIHGYARVLGVVHGVQPVSGAPAIYHHMRCGYEGVEQVVLGANAGEVTAVVARAPGALELCPSAEHRGGQPWLFVRDGAGRLLKDANGQPRAWPSKGDPYEEIYKNPDWYGLVPEQNTKYLDMSEESKKRSDMQNPRGVFNTLVDNVAIFHADLPASSFHPNTYVHYSAEDSRPSWRDMVWEGDPASLEEPGHDPRDNGNGSYNGWFGHGLPEVTAKPMNDDALRHAGLFPIPDGSGGDGTVPTDSAQSPAKAGKSKGVQASFRHGSKGKGARNTEKGYEHADSYNNKRVQWATLYSVIKIAQAADWHPDDGCAS